MKPRFWKLSMSGDSLKNILEVLEWIRQGVVLVHKDTGAPGGAKTPQGTHFVQPERTGDYFYLCHGNNEPGVLLLGQFSGPANVFSAKREGWAERPFRWIKTATSTRKYEGEKKWWTPNADTTFIQVPVAELGMFEELILRPYFGCRLCDFRVAIEE
jgi:5-methylcytosine-specific restriction protein B